MTIDRTEAAAALLDIEAIARRVKQSTFYRIASGSMIAWGVLVAIGHATTHFVPWRAPTVWIVCDSVGLVATAVMVFRATRGRAGGFDLRFPGAMLLFFGFGLLWSLVLGKFGGRELDAFWPSLFMFGYALAGLWLGRALVVIGLSIAALTVAGYLWIGPWFELWLALVDGGGLVLCGLWMRRA